MAGAHPARPAPHPRRGRGHARGVPGKKTRAATFAALLREAAGLPDGLDGDCLETDLAFLDNHTTDIPVSLPNSALFLAQAWQNLIAANELPVVADQMAADGGRLPAAGQSAPPDAWVTTIRSLRTRTRTPAEFAAQLPRCPVRQETLAGELRTPVFARLAAKAAAVVTAAVATAPEAPGAVRPVLASARTVTRTGYQATKVTGGSGWMTLLAGVLLAVIGVVLATQGMMAVGLTGSIIALVGALPDRSGRLGHPPRRPHRPRRHHRAGLPGAAHAALGAHRAVGQRQGQQQRLVPRDVLPWLRDSWWAGLAVLGGIIVLAVLLSLIPRRRPRRNRAPKGAGPPPVLPEHDSLLSGGQPADAAQAPVSEGRCAGGRSPCCARQRPPVRHGVRPGTIGFLARVTAGRSPAGRPEARSGYSLIMPAGRNVAVSPAL